MSFSSLRHRLSLRRIAIFWFGLTAACAPLYVVRWHYGPLPTTLLETLILISVVLYALTLWSERAWPERTPLDIPIAVLLVAGVVSVFDAPSITSALGTYRAYFIEAIACYYVGVGLLRNRADVTAFLLIAGAGACVFSAGQVISFLQALATHTLNLSAAPSFLNTSANDDAMYLEAPFAFALAFALFAPRLKERIVGAAMFAIVAVGLLVSFSRASYLAVAVLAFVLVMSAQTPRHRLWAVGGLAVLGLIVLEIPFVNQRFQTLANSVANRDALYREAVEMLSQRPILGAGLDGFAVRVAPFRPPGAIVHIYPHDVWLTTWSEIGLAGVVVFALIVIALIVRGARNLGSARDLSRPLLWGSVGALVLFVVHGLFDSPYWKNDLSVEFWVVDALQVVAIRASRLGWSDPERLTRP